MIIENSKIYDVTDVENIFFRPTFCGKSAEEFGIRILYNMPMPTKVPMFTHNTNILAPYTSGWQGGTSAEIAEQEIEMIRLKAESACSAENYFSTVYDYILNSSDVNMGDLTGSDLEKAETELFRRALAESVYANTWFGDTEGELSEYTGFTGFIRHILDLKEEYGEALSVVVYDGEQEALTEFLLRQSWVAASDDLRSLANDGHLAYFVSSDIYDAYQFILDSNGSSNAYSEKTGGRPVLRYHGIPLVEVPSQKYNLNLGHSFCILTDSRNLVLALNTNDSPEKEIRMWYNPDEMENRQRVVFLAGTTIADRNLLSGYIYNGTLTLD